MLARDRFPGQPPPVRFPGSLLLLPLVAIFVSSCAAYRPEPLVAADTAAEFQQRRPPALTGRGPWNLARLTPVAWQWHPDLAVAGAQLATARAAAETAGEIPNPTVNLSPQITEPLHWLEGTYGLDFDIPIETGGKRGSRRAGAQARIAQAAFQLAEVKWTVRSRLRQSLLALFAATRREELLAPELAGQAQVLEALQQRVAAGETARPELVTSQLFQNQLRLQMADARRAAAEAQVNVASALGLPASALAGANWDWAEFERAPSAPGWAVARREALTHRPDLLAGLADYAATEAALRLEVARQYPDLHLGPGYQWDAGVNKWTVGLGFELPIFNQHRGPIAEATAARAEAAARFRAQQAQVLAELDRAHAGFRFALEKLQTAGELLAAQESQVGSAQKLLAAGEGDRPTLVSADLERAAAALSRLDALVEAQTALGALEDATQTPLSR